MKVANQPLFQDKPVEGYRPDNFYSTEFESWAQLKYPTSDSVTFSLTPPTVYPVDNISLPPFWPDEDYMNSLTSSACLPSNSVPMDFGNSLSSMVSVPTIPNQKLGPVTTMVDDMMNNYSYMMQPSSFIETSYMPDLLLSDSNSILTASPPQYLLPSDYTPYPLSSHQTPINQIESVPLTKPKQQRTTKTKKLKSSLSKEMKTSVNPTAKLTKLERNRIAASKCRQKTKKWQEEIINTIEKNNKENDLLESELMELKQQIMDLKILLASATCDKQSV